MAERRPRCVPICVRDTHTANTAVSICQYILLTNIYKDDLQLGKLKVNCFATQALLQTQKNVLNIFLSLQ